MSKPFFIVNILLLLFTSLNSYAADSTEKTGAEPIVITSESLTADDTEKTALFEGSVVAKTGETTIYSDVMKVFYGEKGSKIQKIHARGNVKVFNKEKAIFSDEAEYLDQEEKIVFSGNPKAVEGENIVTGEKIIFFMKNNRAVVEGSRMILRNKEEAQ